MSNQSPEIEKVINDNFRLLDRIAEVGERIDAWAKLIAKNPNDECANWGIQSFEKYRDELRKELDELCP